MSFIISFGKWGGFYFQRGWCVRLCLGFVAFTFMPKDIDEVLSNLLARIKS